MDSKTTHRVTYLTKDDVVRVVETMSVQEKDDIVLILNANEALYTIEDLTPKTISIAI